MAKEFSTFEEFWPFYVGEHSKKLTRTFHFIGTTAALGCTAGALLTGNVLADYGVEKAERGMYFSPDGRLIGTGSFRKGVYVWRLPEVP